ncbi:MAG: signal peptidase II [candidate division WOR-3 bacterium]
MLRRPFVWTAIAALFLDQVSKLLVYGLIERGESVRVVGDLLRFSHSENPHGVFGLPFGPPILYIVVQGVVAALVVRLGIRAKGSWLASAFGMILGGALGNLADRIRLGRVIDFIDFEVRAVGFRWYTFNLADAFVVIGILMMLGYELHNQVRCRRQRRLNPKEENNETRISGQ